MTVGNTERTFLPSPGPAALRDEFEKMIVGDLLGPADGPTERFPATGAGRRVRDRYVVGMLAPKGTVAVDEERNDDEAVPEPDVPGTEGGDLLERAAAKPSFFPSSLGMSFVVDDGCDSLRVTARWGRYRKEYDEGEEGRRIPMWQREPVAVSLTVECADGPIDPRPVSPEYPAVVLRGRVRRPVAGGKRMVTLFLVNEQTTPEINKDEAWLFQAGFAVEDVHGSPVFLGRSEALPPGVVTPPEAERVEVEMLDMHYRDQVEFAVGHGTAVHVTKWDQDPRRAIRIETAVVPRYEIPRTEAPRPEDVPELAGVVLDMKLLSELEPAELRRALEPLAVGYRAWLDRERQRIGDPSARLAGHEETAEAVLDEAQKVADAIQAGIDLVCADDPDNEVLEAFRFANRVMWRQRVHYMAAADRQQQPKLTLAEAVAARDVPANRSWRPFQLAFLCLCLPSLADPTHPDRGHPGLIDLLFFPTGGGKTEAYLGLVAFTLAIRRLQRDKFGLDGSDGVAAFMRYTLRLLTTQQFQRAAALICAAELERKADPNKRLGEVPFRLGMWVGGAVTPNLSRDSDRVVEDARLGRGGRRASPLQLVACPWCGEGFEEGKHLERPEANGAKRTLLYCSNRDCEFTKRKAPGEGVPVVTVDEEIYRFLPSFVIATVDKFAQLPWQGPLKMLFGRVDRRCSIHGYRHPDLDSRLRWERDTHRAGKTYPVSRLRPPDLILQDELHLITGPLGTMTGLYETAIDRLSSWEVEGTTVRPKVVASTATVRRAQQQAHAVFWRSLRVFPPPALDAGRQFFSQQIEPSPSTPGRAYLGICGRGIRFKQVELRVFSAMLAAAQALYEKYGKAADPYMTLVGYFNARRELAGMKRLADDELRQRLRRAGALPGLASRTRLIVEELTSRVSSAEIPSILARLAIEHDPAADDEAADPVDLLLATSMLSVGVDLPRLGAMVAVGQPKESAEYIQATSRVGRSADKPGLVVTIYNWARPRDLSHYESFEHYHATLNRYVEPLSVTPFSARALDKGLTGVLASHLRHLRDDWNPNPGARRVDRHDPEVASVVDAIVRRAEDVTGDTKVGDAVRAELDRRLDEWEVEKVNVGPYLAYDKKGADDVPLLRKPEAGNWGIWTCPNSLRDTEANVNLLVDDHDPTRGAQPDFEPFPASDDAHGADLVETAEDEDVEPEVEAEEALT